MSFSVNWHGDVIETASVENLRTTKTGTFRSATGVTTYFPLPMSFISLTKTVGKYSVSAEFSNRPDLIAKELYGSEDLWWVIFWSNGLLDPFKGPVAGDTINIIDIVSFKSIFK